MRVLVTLKGGRIFEEGDQTIMVVSPEGRALHSFVAEDLPGQGWLFEIRPAGAIPGGITVPSSSAEISDSSSSSRMGGD